MNRIFFAGSLANVWSAVGWIARSKTWSKNGVPSFRSFSSTALQRRSHCGRLEGAWLAGDSAEARSKNGLTELHRGASRSWPNRGKDGKSGKLFLKEADAANRKSGQHESRDRTLQRFHG